MERLPKVFREQLDSANRQLRRSRERFIDGLTLKQYTKWQKYTRKLQEQHGDKWLQHADITKISKAWTHSRRLEVWQEAAHEFNCLFRRSELRLVA